MQCQIPSQISPTGLSNIKTKFFQLKSLHIHWLLEKPFKSQDGIKGKNSISQQAELLSEHSRVCGKNAWDIKNQKKPTTNKQTNKRLPTALEQKHSCCTSSIHGLEFLAYTFNNECHSGRHTSCLLSFQHLLSMCTLCWKAMRCVLSETLLINVQKMFKKSHAC